MRHSVAKYCQVSKYCEACRAVTPHELREQEGFMVKICVACLLRGYLSSKQEAEGS
jgi:hypothetical protein